MSDSQNLNQSSPGALSTGAPPSLSPPLTPAPPTPSTAQNTPPPPTTSDATASPSTTTTANSGAVPGVMGRASTGAPAQPAGEGLAQGGNTIVISGGGSGGSGETLAAVQVANFNAAVSTIYPCNPGAGNINATLPTGSGVVGGQITPIEIYNNTNDVGTVTILPTGTDTVAGLASLVLQPQQSVRLVWDGVSNWMTAP